MLSKQGIYNATRFCCEDISLIENYDKAFGDKTNTVWDCHHRLEITLNKSKKELKEIGLYWNRPASELIFLTHSEHKKIHRLGTKHSQQTLKKLSISGKKRFESQEERDKISKAQKGIPKKKCLWLTPDDKLILMTANVVSRCHPDWIKIERID